MLYQNTGSAEPGSGPLFGSVSGLESQLLGSTKDTFATEPKQIYLITDQKLLYRGIWGF